MLSYGILYNPSINDRIMTERYTVRHLDLRVTDPPNEQPGEDGASRLGSHALGKSNAVDQNPARSLAQKPQMTREGSGLQTLVQPEFHSHVKLPKEIPTPTIVIWAPELAASKEIVAPLPDKATAADVKPSLDAPNEELNLSDYGVTAIDLAPHAQAIPAGSTSPVALHSADVPQLAPATISNSALQPTPTALLSLSDIRMPEGEITLPPMNDTKGSAASDAPSQGPGKVVSAALKENEVAKVAEKRQQGGENALAPHAAEAGSAAVTESDTNHITLPKDGRFGVVVVGTSLADEYPETLEVWNDRVAYTAYLHVGLSKNWILQYSLIRSVEAASGGVVARLEAPWPYDIVRPNLVSRDLNADALMVHGILNQSGRFESLAIAFPALYKRASFVLYALQQWQFRPARQNGKAIAVEVLLIIPDELD